MQLWKKRAKLTTSSTCITRRRESEYFMSISWRSSMYPSRQLDLHRKEENEDTNEQNEEWRYEVTIRRKPRKTAQTTVTAGQAILGWPNKETSEIATIQDTSCVSWYSQDRAERDADSRINLTFKQRQRVEFTHCVGTMRRLNSCSRTDAYPMPRVRRTNSLSLHWTWLVDIGRCP